MTLYPFLNKVYLLDPQRHPFLFVFDFHASSTELQIADLPTKKAINNFYPIVHSFM